MDYLIHVANVLYLFSYLVRDILWLRLLTVVAACLLMPYFYFRPDPLIAAIAWNVLFTGINLYNIVILYMERRPVDFNDEEQNLYQVGFRSLTPREFLRLLKMATWKEVQAGHKLIEKGTCVNELLTIYSGNVDICVDGKRVSQLQEGCFLGEMGFLTKEPSSADAVASSFLRYVSWKHEDLEQSFQSNPDFKAAVQAILSKDLVAKLKKVA